MKQEKIYGSFYTPQRYDFDCAPFLSTFSQKTPSCESLKMPIFSGFSTDSVSFTFTGKEKDSESGFYYFGARYYDCDLSGLFLSVDPMSDKYPNISPYHYCHWNPIIKIDPDGNDEWEINQQGKVVNRIETKEHDAFFIVDDKGNRIMDENNSVLYKAISFKYGSVSEMPSIACTQFQTVFESNDNSVGTDLFKFFADNTSVEYGLVTTKESGAYVITNHKKGSVKVTNLAIGLDLNGLTILSVSHNHPGGSGPSGFDRNNTHGDKFSAQRLVISHNHTVKYFVYTKQDQQFTPYNGDRIFRKISISMFKNNCN